MKQNAIQLFYCITFSLVIEGFSDITIKMLIGMLETYRNKLEKKYPSSAFQKVPIFETFKELFQNCDNS